MLGHWNTTNTQHVEGTMQQRANENTGLMYTGDTDIRLTRQGK